MLVPLNTTNKQTHHVVEVHEWVIDGDDSDFGVLDRSAKHDAADAAKPACCHKQQSPFMHASSASKQEEHARESARARGKEEPAHTT